MISRMEWAAGRKLRANAGETLTEVLISVLVIALGMMLFLSAFLASGRMLQQGEEQMAGYYDSRNQLENNRTAEQASGRYVLELEASGTGGMKKSLASNAYQTGTQTNYRTGQYPIVLYVSQADSDAEEEEVNLQELIDICDSESGLVILGGAAGGDCDSRYDRHGAWRRRDDGKKCLPEDAGSGRCRAGAVAHGAADDR